LYRRLDCCSLAGGQPWKPYYQYEEVKELFGFLAEVTRTATAILCRSQTFGGNAVWLKERAKTGESDQLLNILEELNKVLTRRARPS